MPSEKNDVSEADVKLVAYCGLYCGSCRRYAGNQGRCAGCAENHKATWCKPRSCCIQNGHATCADCQEHTDPMDCGKLNNLLSRLFGVLFNSDRRANIEYLRANGTAAFAAEMAARGEPTFKRRG